MRLVLDAGFSVPYPDKLPAIPKECDADGSPYLWMLSGNGVEVVGFTPKGVVAFGSSQMTDIPEPRPGELFAADSGIYLLVEGTEDARDRRASAYDESSKKDVIWSEKVGQKHQYIARFSKDGSYKGALKLDLALQVVQIAAFDSGYFLVAGVDASKIPRVALLSPSGQLLKFVDLENDTTAGRKSAEKTFAAAISAAGGADTLAMFARMSPYHGGVLLVRSRTGTPIYEISDGGEVRTMRVTAPKGYVLDRLIPSERDWVVDFVKPSAPGSTSDGKHAFYEVDPETGDLLKQYRFEHDSKTYVACWREGEFVAVRHADGRVTVLRGRPEPAESAVSP